LVLYRPGTGTIWILGHSGGQFAPVYQQGDPGAEILLYSADDRLLAFDYAGNGTLNHLVLYRPGTGDIRILGRNAGQWLPVGPQDPLNSGIGGYDLRSTSDRIFAFDYNGSGRQDHLALYRPGTGTIWILSNSGGVFTPVYQQGDPGAGIGGYDLARPSDRIFAFDYNRSGRQDHLVLHRPGTGTIWILRNLGGRFAPIYQQGDPGSGIGGYDLARASDRVLAFDYDGSGRQDHLVLYRPGTGTIWILR
jgi:hypothetical protein